MEVVLVVVMKERRSQGGEKREKEERVEEWKRGRCHSWRGLGSVLDWQDGRQMRFLCPGRPPFARDHA